MSGTIEILRKNLMILASAGSGKTFQLGNRVIGLVGRRGVDPERIVALTFTRKAAGEFADSVLEKLAAAARDPRERAALEEQLGGPVDPGEVLERVVRALPRFQLGTIDGFFSRVVRGFQHELGLSGGSFELVQGPKLDGLLEDVVSGILVDALGGEAGEEFLHAFRRATMGKEENQVSRSLRKFFERWHGWWKTGGDAGQFGAGFGDLPEPVEWEKQKAGMVEGLRRATADTAWTHGSQAKAMAKMLDQLEAHGIGSGSLEKCGSLFTSLLDGLANEGPLRARLHKEIELTGEASDAFRRTIGLLVDCELSAAVLRTRAVGALVACYDGECDRRLRRRGLLGFDDVKVLMGEWSRSEEARLRREAVDFRLDGRYDHWLLDEFQDTSRAEWTALKPLIDEAVSDEEGTFFVVGDEKQAIYGWRGGEVQLFRELRECYARGDDERAMRVQPMPDSWRSCGAVLELVNAVCGQPGLIEELFGANAAGRWQWEEHVAARGGLAGEARVEMVGREKEDRHERLVALLEELGVRDKQLSCGVLVRTNAQVREIAERLRCEGFDVIEEGIRRPTEDNPAGVALLHLVRWLADPADGFARNLLGMSPLAAVIEAGFGSPWQAAWESMLAEARRVGFAGVAERVIEGLPDGLSEFGRRRVGDVLAALAAFDASGGSSAREALRWIEGLEVSQSPGVAAVQVMNIHKSKGLGFDLVVLPEVDDKQVPNAGNYEIAEGDGWVLQPPAQWVRKLVPGLRAAEEKWGDEQRYEMMCLLYVALTRAKQGLYLILSEPPSSWKDDHASAANWVMRSVGGGEDGVLWQSGCRDWLEAVPARQAGEDRVPVKLGEGVARRARTTPSRAQSEGHGGGSAGGRQFGTAVHEVFERVGWLDEEAPELPGDEAGRCVAELLALPEIRRAFERAGREAELFREQPVEAIVDGRWLSGVIDRLHVIDGGSVVELIDFKTDGVEQAAELLERHAGQMAAYRGVLQQVHPGAEIRCLLLSTRLKSLIEVP